MTNEVIPSAPVRMISVEAPFLCGGCFATKTGDALVARKRTTTKEYLPAFYSDTDSGSADTAADRAAYPKLSRDGRRFRTVPTETDSPPVCLSCVSKLVFGNVLLRQSQLRRGVAWERRREKERRDAEAALRRDVDTITDKKAISDA